MTRGELIESIAINHRLTKRTTSVIVEVVMDAAIAECIKAKMGDDWNGSRAIQAMYELRGGRPCCNSVASGKVSSDTTHNGGGSR
jgi:hypothetical protein